ncbi:MAG: hypothetical protein EBZ91_04090 [Gammaproteobacteria bacterium]|nr:hypothetical protein [Gammaproteobacteria bacterium]
MLAVSAIAIGLLAIGGSSRLTANTSVLPPGALAPSARERMIARQVGSLLEDAHYSRLKIDDALSPRVMDKFLDGMDGQRSYFLASDIAEFEAYRLRFDDMIRTGDIEPAYAMFARYQQRNRERVQYALSLLDTEPDFKLDEQFEFDREGAAWPATKAELIQDPDEPQLRGHRCVAADRGRLRHHHEPDRRRPGRRRRHFVGKRSDHRRRSRQGRRADGRHRLAD